MGQRLQLRPGLIGLDPRHRPRPPPGGALAVWLHLGEYPLHAGQRNASWRAEAFGVWEGYVDVWAGGLHLCAACDDQALSEALESVVRVKAPTRSSAARAALDFSPAQNFLKSPAGRYASRAGQTRESGWRGWSRAGTAQARSPRCRPGRRRRVVASTGHATARGRGR